MVGSKVRDYEARKVFVLVEKFKEREERVRDEYQCLLFLRGKNGGIVRNRGQFCFFCSQSRYLSYV